MSCPTLHASGGWGMQAGKGRNGREGERAANWAGAESSNAFNDGHCLLLQDAGIEDWSGVAAVLCGQKGMCEAVTELLTSKGVAKEHILLNF